MKKMLFVFIICLMGLSLSAQKDEKPFEDKPANFALVDFAANHSGDGYVCIVKYSNGKVYSLDKTLNMIVKEGHLINQDDMDAQKFKILDYFNEMGFDFVNIVYESSFLDSHYTVALREKYPSLCFYFKRKGI